jgi:hypothetical protein
VNIPLGVISRAQSGLQKGYAAQMINAFGSVLSLGSNAAHYLAARHSGMACLRFRRGRHHNDSAERMDTLFATTRG